MSGYGKDDGGFFDDADSSSSVTPTASRAQAHPYRATTPSYAVASYQGFPPYGVNPLQLYQRQLHAQQIQQQRNQMMQHHLAFRELQTRAAQNHGYLPIPGTLAGLNHAQSPFLSQAGPPAPSPLHAPSLAPPKAAAAPKPAPPKEKSKPLTGASKMPAKRTDLELPSSRTKIANTAQAKPDANAKVAQKSTRVAPKRAPRREVKHAKPIYKLPTPPSIPKPVNDVELVQVEESYMIPFSPLHGQVWRAVRLVGEEIKTGVWPLAKQELKISLPVVLEQFIREIFLPHLQGKGAVDNRPYVATMLALREVMTQNGKQLFHLDLDKPSHMDEDYCAQLLATSVVLAANARQTEDNLDLLAFVEAYDGGDPEFKDALTPMAAKHKPIAPGGGGTQLSRQEALVWKVAYNMARDKHPLMRVKGVTKDRKKITLSLPKPTACFVAMVEEFSPRTMDQIRANE